MNTEKRFTPQSEVRLEGGQDGQPAKITGYAAVYNSLSKPMKTTRGTTFRERIIPGAFADATTADVLARYNHELIIGRTKSGTLTLSLDARGLRYEITPPSSEAAKHVVESIRRGDIDGSSFAFRTIQDGWKIESGEAIRELRSLDLIDVGPVDLPAYTATAEGDHAVSLRAEDADEQAIDAEVAKLKGGEHRCGSYYYDPGSSSLTASLRTCIEACRVAFDRSQSVLDALTANAGAQLTPQEARAAADCAEEIAQTVARCTTAADACRDAAGIGGERSKATPELDKRRERFASML